MSAAVDIVDPRREPDWDARVSSWPEASVFHSSGWTHALTEGFDSRPCYLVLRNGRDLRAVLPMMETKMWFRGTHAASLPFSDYCSALVRGPADLGRLVDAALSVARTRRWRSVEFRGPLDVRADGHAALEYLVHEIDLQVSPEQQWQGLRPDVRRAIKKAQAAGFEMATGHDERALREFYWLHSLTRRRHGLPPQPGRFFAAVKRHLLDRGYGSIILVRRNERPVAAALFLRFGVRALFKFGASDEHDLADRPNDLALWEGINWCRSQGARFLSLGKTHRDHEGLRRFKRGWGTSEFRLPYYRYNPRCDAFESGRDWLAGWHNHVFRRLPVPVLQWTGNLLYRQAA